MNPLYPYNTLLTNPNTPLVNPYDTPLINHTLVVAPPLSPWQQAAAGARRGATAEAGGVARSLQALLRPQDGPPASPQTPAGAAPPPRRHHLPLLPARLHDQQQHQQHQPPQQQQQQEAEEAHLGPSPGDAALAEGGVAGGLKALLRPRQRRATPGQRGPGTLPPEPPAVVGDERPPVLITRRGEVGWKQVWEGGGGVVMYLVF